jgi:hypothetical protein
MKDSANQEGMVVSFDFSQKLPHPLPLPEAGRGEGINGDFLPQRGKKSPNLFFFYSF